MKPDQKTIDELIKALRIYNNAKTAEEGFGALNNMIKMGRKKLKETVKKNYRSYEIRI